MNVVICQHNILAPLWVTSEYSLLPCAGKFFNPGRLYTTLEYLAKVRADVYCLCEVQESSLAQIDSAFRGHKVFFAANEPEYWSEWLHGKEAASNGTCVLLRRGEFSSCSAVALPLGDGCVCCLAHCTHIASGSSLLIASVHFDTGSRKHLEAESLLAFLEAQYPGVDLTVISGDYNSSDTDAFTSRGYKEHSRRDDTTPLYQGMIDHTLLLSRGDLTALGRVLSVPKSRPVSVRELVSSVCDTVSVNGSDHFATITRVNLPPK